MNKAAVRKAYIAKRKELSAEEVRAKSKAIAEHFIHSDIWKKSEVVHVFIPIPDKAEVDTFLIIDFFFKHHPEIKLCTSILSDVTGELLHTYITPETTYQLNAWNIPEPVERKFLKETEIDLVLIPLLAFDMQGARVGYGKGFYDRFLLKCKVDTKKAGLSLFEPADELIETDAWDIPIGKGVTPTQIYTF